MKEIQIIDIREAILSDNDNMAQEIRDKLNEKKVFLLNLMASPGAGKTSLVLATIKALSPKYRIAVIEGDIDSIVDAEKVNTLGGVPAVQLQTGGGCHLDAAMVDAALQKLDLDNLELIIIENIGNLVCPAEFDTGANIRVMISSVPEGDDKVLKYPLMFTVSEVLIVNKTDYLPDPGFNFDLVKTRVRNLNPSVEIFPLSCRSGEGLDEWATWLSSKIEKTLE